MFSARLILSISLFWLALAVSLAQSVEPPSPSKKPKLGKEVMPERQFDIFTFPYLEEETYFFHSKKLDRIYKAINQGSSEKAYGLLRTYVHHFAISNFRRDGRLLHELAGLSSRYGPSGERLKLLKLILQHRPLGIDSAVVRAGYDSLEPIALKYYVPAVQYYELASQKHRENDSITQPGLLRNAGDLLNSKYADYAPAIGNRDDLLLFTSKRNFHSTEPNALPDEDLFISTRENGIWNRAIEVRAINTSLNEGSACLSRNGKTLIFSRCFGPGSFGNCDLYQAQLNEDSVWVSIKNMGSAINSSGWDSHPALSLSGDTLFFASNRLGGFGMSDIYFSVRNEDGEWEMARNMGPLINSRLSEVSPFLHHRYNILYYSSDGLPVTFGDFDIYLSRQEGLRWGEPVNAGPLVNGPGSDYYFTVDAESSEIFFSRPSMDGSAGIDIYSVPLPMEAHPLAEIVLTGNIRLSNGKPAEGIVFVFDLENHIEVAPKFLSVDGSFNFSLIRNRRYLLVVEGEGFQKLEERIFLNGPLEVNRTVQENLPKIAFASVEFEPGKAEILPTMVADLQKLGQLLAEHPEWKLKISGHADAAGDASTHQELSQLRADAIRNFLIAEHHIDPERILAIGYGSTQPLISWSDRDADRRINRRVEFELYK